MRYPELLAGCPPADSLHQQGRAPIPPPGNPGEPAYVRICPTRADGRRPGGGLRKRVLLEVTRPEWARGPATILCLLVTAFPTCSSLVSHGPDGFCGVMQGRSV